MGFLNEFMILFCFLSIACITLTVLLHRANNKIYKLTLKNDNYDAYLNEALQIWRDNRRVMNIQGWYGIDPFFNKRLYYCLSTAVLNHESFKRFQEEESRGN